MYYIMLKFPFLYIGLRKTIKDIFKLVGEKKIWSVKYRGKPGRISICLTNQHPGSQKTKKLQYWRFPCTRPMTQFPDMHYMTL